MTPDAGAPRPRPLRVVVFVLLVIAAVLVSADRITATVVQRQVSARLQTELASVETPEVTVDRFPFLTQFAAQDFVGVHVVANGVNTAPNRAEGSIPVAHADLRLADVRSSDGYATVTAGSIEGTAKLDYPTISGLAGFPVAYGGDNRVQATLARTVLGVGVNVTVTGVVNVDESNQTLSITEPQLAFASLGVSEAVSQAVIALVMSPIPVTGIPPGVHVSSVTPTQATVDFHLTGTDVAITG